MLKPKSKKQKHIDPIIKEITKLLEDVYEYDYYKENLEGNMHINEGNIANTKKELLKIIDEDIINYINNTITEDDSNKLQLIQQIKDDINEISKEYKEIFKQKEKYEKEITKLNTERKNLIKMIVKEEEELEELGNNFEPDFKYFKPKKSSINIYSFKDMELLPKVGVLYSDNKGKNRELAIYKWDELDLGETEANRLNANLVCEINI